MRRRLPLGLFFIAAGALHFAFPRAYEAIVPRRLPASRALVYASGAAEIAGGLAVVDRRSARWGAGWLIATLLAVFPANVGMALHAERFSRVPEPLLWARLPFQAVFIAWVWWAALRR
jgi:uncharacterized membrane protein